MPSPVVLRPTHIHDAEELRKQCWPDRPPQAISTLLHRAEKLLAQRRGLGAVALWDDVICGFGMLTIWPQTAEISDLVVSPAHRSNGIGSEIIRFLAQHAAAMGASILEIGVACSNPRALALYRRLGFVDHHMIEVDLGNGPEAVLYLHKQLLSPQNHHSELAPR